MNNNKKMIAIQANSIASLDIANDTTVLICCEFLRRGYRVIWYHYSQLYMKNKLLFANGVLLQAKLKDLDYDNSNFSSYFLDIWQNRIEITINIEECNLILIRQNPPFDLNYLGNLHLLSLTKTLVLNNPVSLMNHGEKIIPLQVLNGEYIPETLITSSKAIVKEFFLKHQNIVIKDPWDYGGHGVIKITDLQQLEDLQLEKNNKHYIVQKFLAKITEGDTRIMMVEGKILCHMSRVPLDGDFISNLCAGGQCVTKKLSKKTKEICNKVSDFLVKNNIFFAGIDIIDDFLIEVNITCVGTLTYANKLHNKQFEKILVDRMEAKMI